MVSAATYFLVTLVIIGICAFKRLSSNYNALKALQLPGPILAKLTSKWVLYQFVRSKRMTTVHALHLKHGPVVQTGPREISFATADACKAIYGFQTRTSKAKVYDSFGPPSLFTFRDKEKHRERRRQIAHVFAGSVLKDIEASMQQQITKFVNIVRKNEGMGFDVFKTTKLLALDIAGEILLGQAFNAQDVDELPYFVQMLSYVHPMFALNSDAPWVPAILRQLPFSWAKDFTGAVDYVYGYGAQRLEESVATHGRNATENQNLLTKLIAGDPLKSIPPISDKEISNEITNFIYAGTDTTALSLAYFLYELASHPTWQDEVRREIRSAQIHEKDWSYPEIQKLQLLQACMHESMRLHPAIGPGLPRQTPPEGMQIAGISVPGNIAVSVPMIDVQRNADAFPEPDTFNPRRWLSGSSAAPNFRWTPEMQAHWFLWGGGEYTCAGQNIAAMEIAIATSRLLDEFVIRVESPQTHIDMEMCDHFVVAPKGGRGMLVFDRYES